MEFDSNNPSDLNEQVAAAVRSFDKTSYSKLSRRLRAHATLILTAEGLPADIASLYSRDGNIWKQGDGQEALELWQLLVSRGFAEDTPAGYAVRALYLLNGIDELQRANRYDEALAMSFAAGELITEAGIKEIWEKDALRGYKVIESAREGHTAVHGTAQDKAADRALQLEAFEKARSRGLGKTAAYEAAGEECGVTSRTIQRSVTGK